MKMFPYFLLVLLIGISCQQHSSTSPPATSSNIKQLRLNLCHEPPSMDPRKGGDGISSHMHFLFFEGLTRLNEDGSISCAQAESIDISPDGKLYTFHLRDCKWSNGDSVTAEDYEKSWKDILDPTFPSVNAHLFYPIFNALAAKQGLVPLSEIGIRSLNSKTLEVKLEHPTPYFLDLISFCSFFPVNKRIDELDPSWAYEAGEHFVSNGPYSIKSWKHNHEIVAVRNEKYWAPEKVLTDSIHFSMVDNPMTALSMFENKELDFIGDPLSPLPTDAIPTLNKKGKLKKKPIGASTFVTFNTQKIPFSNVNVRKAFAFAINREEIVSNITQLDETIATNVIPPILKNNRNRQFFQDNSAQDAQKLLALGLEQLGMSKEDLKGITYHYMVGDLHGKIAQAVQQQIAKTLGIKVDIEGHEAKVVIDKLTKRDYLLGQFIWAAQYSDQMNILERFKYKRNPKNYADWENAEFIQLLNQSAFQVDEERLATLEKAEEIFLNEMPVAPIYHWYFSYMFQPHIHDPGLSSIGDMYFHDIDLANHLKIDGQVAAK